MKLNWRVPSEKKKWLGRLHSDGAFNS